MRDNTAVLRPLSASCVLQILFDAQQCHKIVLQSLDILLEISKFVKYWMFYHWAAITDFLHEATENLLDNFHKIPALIGIIL